MSRIHQPLSAADTALYQAIAARIRAIRLAQGMSQGRLAAGLGLTRTSIVNLEHGAQRCALHWLCAIARALHVPSWRLLPAPEPKPRITVRVGPGEEISL